MTQEDRNKAKAADKFHNDEYAIAFARQRDGLPCWRCNSFWGHYVHCALINGGPKYTEERWQIFVE